MARTLTGAFDERSRRHRGSRQELATLAHGDRRLMERAHRYIRDAMEHGPDNTTLGQMHTFRRRAFEKESWGWDDKDGESHRYLS
ncbi:MAG: hypothetical protein MP439_08405 [Ferrimicrobium sp.]|nr:hypothetical protein [Ferrimicrobium sp.]